jgi:hypothetical protein
LILGADLCASLVTALHTTRLADLILLVHVTVTIIVEPITDLDATRTHRAGAGIVIGAGGRRI